MKIILDNVPTGSSSGYGFVSLQKTFPESQTTPWHDIFMQMSEGLKVNFMVPDNAKDYPFSNMKEINFCVVQMTSHIDFSKEKDVPKLYLDEIKLHYFNGSAKKGHAIDSLTNAGWKIY
jgi:hypothetical protein